MDVPLSVSNPTCITATCPVPTPHTAYCSIQIGISRAWAVAEREAGWRLLQQWLGNRQRFCGLIRSFLPVRRRDRLRPFQSAKTASFFLPKQSYAFFFWKSTAYHTHPWDPDSTSLWQIWLEVVRILAYSYNQGFEHQLIDILLPDSAYNNRCPRMSSRHTATRPMSRSSHSVRSDIYAPKPLV